MPTKRSGFHGHMTKRHFLLLFLVLAALLAGAYFVFQYLEDNQKRPEPTGDFTSRHQYDETMEVDGRTYRRKSNLTTILLMGIDDYGQNYGVPNQSGGQADFLRLIVIDKAAKTVSQLAIDRDTMTPITTIGVLGARSGTRVLQLCLSHAFGNGREQSCDLTREAVEKLLLDIRIDHYIAMDLVFVNQLNDALGGVTVTLEDDIPNLPPKGTTVTLHGEQTEAFIRARMSVGDGTNESRMRRQQQYITAATELINKKLHEDEEFVNRMYDDLSPLMVKNISKTRLSLEAYNAKDYARPALYEIAGEHTVDSRGYTEFHADADSIRQTVLKLFYDPMN